jgi:GLPGLI family protein
MRVIFLFLFFLVELSPVFAQQGHSVTYQNVEDRYAPITFNGEKRRLPPIVDRLVFNDSLSFCYRIMPDTRDQLKKATIFGDKLVHHAMLYNSNTNLSYSEVAWPKGKQEYLIQGEQKNEDWQFLSGKKEILGYQCRGALLVNEKKDSTLVWFTDSIPKPFGPYTFFGFTGLVLEVYQQPWGTHLRATKIETGIFRVVMPKEGILISLEEYRKLKR